MCCANAGKSTERSCWRCPGEVTCSSSVGRGYSRTLAVSVAVAVGRGALVGVLVDTVVGMTTAVADATTGGALVVVTVALGVWKGLVGTTG